MTHWLLQCNPHRYDTDNPDWLTRAKPLCRRAPCATFHHRTTDRQPGANTSRRREFHPNGRGRKGEDNSFAFTARSRNRPRLSVQLFNLVAWHLASSVSTVAVVHRSHPPKSHV
jgi:hypothetical protein